VRGQSGPRRHTVYFYRAGSGRRLLSCSSTLANKEQNDSGGLFTVPPIPTFESESSSSGVDAASGATDGLIAQTTETFADLGLGGHTPLGLVQTLLEFLHVNAHLPWWASIAAATVGIRLLLFPLAARMMRDSAKIANLNPTASKIHETMAAYKRIGNRLAAAEEGAKLLEIYKRHGVNPVSTMFMVPFFQLPVFISFFWAIRGMTELPLESMKTGGLYWFTDLTVPDPAYVLPLMACLAFITNVEVICSTVKSSV
jgi:YidC/Oxa1 family membrane protein insertase